MTKVKLPYEIATAIIHLRTITNSKHELMRVVEEVSGNPVAKRLYVWAFQTKGGSPDLLMEALVNGFEVEKTPEELQAIAHGKVRDYVAELNRREKRADLYRDYDESAEYMYKRHATMDVLRMLGIKIEGVNA